MPFLLWLQKCSHLFHLDMVAVFFIGVSLKMGNLWKWFHPFNPQWMAMNGKMNMMLTVYQVCHFTSVKWGSALLASWSCSHDARITASLAPSFCKRWVAESISSKEMCQEWSAVSVCSPRWARSKLSTCRFHLIPVSTKGVLWGTSLDVVVNAPRTCKTSTGIFGCPNSSSQIVVNSDRASGVAISAQNEKTQMRLYCSWQIGRHPQKKTITQWRVSKEGGCKINSALRFCLSKRR